jgi:predicted regulator of Ras-like GTPase activity (Roadblock/LC7/MglB family)
MARTTIADTARDLFEELYADIPEIKGILLATAEGLPLVYDFKEEQSPDRVAALAASALGIGNRLMPLVDMEQVREVNISNATGRIHLCTVGASAALCILTPKAVNTGMLHLKASQVARRFEEILN